MNSNATETAAEQAEEPERAGAGLMSCPVCGKEIEDDSRFCEFCGAALTAPDLAAPEADAETAEHGPDGGEHAEPEAAPEDEAVPEDETIPEDKVAPEDEAAPEDGAPEEDEAGAEELPVLKEEPAAADAAAARVEKSNTVRGAILGLLLVAAAIAAFVIPELFRKQNENAVRLETEQAEEIARLENELAEQKTSFDELAEQLKEQNASLKTESETLGDIADALADALMEQAPGTSVGYASDNFRVSQGTVILRKDETATVRLTAYWPDGGNASVARSSDCASIVALSDSWTEATDLAILGNYPGVCVTTFTNDRDDGVFSMLIIVLDA